MGKKPVGKAKAKAGYVKEEEPKETPEELAAKAEARRIWQVRKDASKWVTAQLEVVRNLVEAAKDRAKKDPCDWLVIALEFHEVRLIKLQKRLEEKTLDSLEQEFKDGIAAFLAQFSGGQVDKENLKEFQQVWDIIPSEDGESYKRQAETDASSGVIAELKEWSDGSEDGISKFASKMQGEASSGGVQEAGLIRIGGLFGEAERGASMPGLSTAALMPAISAAMKNHLKDPEVQRAGCAALRGLAKAEGQLPALCDAGGADLVVTAIQTHYKVKDVAATGNASIWAMAQAAGKQSPELATLVTAGTVEVLMKVMHHHAWDQTLCGQVRVVLPFLVED
eukprot:TRINITY_DN10604_c0_g1_i1.p1 TRINITY_DN10604_c0_g1~~TRINITY_DN10604_c0_g1_i1.p1  ORF type:complete len:337 (+),score=85.62 TRINITY_DN10604_c0_g1_i1:79-1089(+)